LPPPGTVVSTSPEVTSPKQNSSQFIVKRTHAPPANLSTVLRSKNSTQRLYRFAPLQILTVPEQRSLPGREVLAGASSSALDSPELKQPQVRTERAHAPPMGGMQDSFTLVSLRIPRAAIDPHLPQAPASLPSAKHFVRPSWFAAAIAQRSSDHFSNKPVHTGLAWFLPGKPIPAPGDNDNVRF
jgi:hypothetical protein